MADQNRDRIKAEIDMIEARANVRWGVGVFAWILALTAAASSPAVVIAVWRFLL